MKQRTNITIDTELYKQVKEHIKNNGQTFSGLISMLLRREIK